MKILIAEDALGSRYIYIIMVKSQGGTDNLVTGMEAGADDFITKPYNKEEPYVRLKAGERVLNFETRDIVIPEKESHPEMAALAVKARETILREPVVFE